LLFVAMARHHGIPARARVGFAGYLVVGWWLDHANGFLVGPDAWRACRSGAADPATFDSIYQAGRQGKAWRRVEPVHTLDLGRAPRRGPRASRSRLS